MSNKPNLFHWATSELSQDAFICWLLSWANYGENDEKALPETAKYFISKLTDKKIADISKVEIIRQYQNIDILCKVNDELVILIEDKTHSKNHSEQLERYYNLLLKNYARENIYPVYLKTGDQSEFAAVRKAGYRVFLRSDFIDVLKYALAKNTTNQILIDFHKHLTAIEQSFQSYKTLPVSQWHWDSWKGFYSALQQRLNDGAWDYVPQKNGGFLGFWWCWLHKEQEDVEFEYYLQLEHQKFCFKLYPYEREQAEKSRQIYRKLLYEKAKEYNIPIYQNGRIGNYMTVAALSEPYLKTDSNGYIDLDKTVELLKRIEAMLASI